MKAKLLFLCPLLTNNYLMVKKIFLAVLVLSVVLSSCKKHNGFVISGKITNSEGKYLYLDELKVSSSVPVDSVMLERDGSFRFKGEIGYPNFYLLRLNQRNFITLLVDTVEKITVNGDAANFSRDYTVEGSPGSLLVQELNTKLAHTKHQLDSIRSRIDAFRTQDGYSNQKTKWDQELNEIKQKQIRYSTNFIQKHPFSLASVLALYQKFDDSNYVIQDLQSLKVAASALNTMFPKSEHVRALYANTQRLMVQEKNDKMKKFIAENGENSPDISLPDKNGRMIALSSISAKVILIQFWSSVDRVSRYQNQALAELYSKYKSRGLEIYQVSIDDNRSAWITAIEQDGLSWINVGDMKGSNAALNSYNVQIIPSNYILDKERRVVARDLLGPALDQAVAKMLKQ
jgi:peroxiredoxin